MTGKTIPQLPGAAALTGAEVIETVQSGISVKTTAQDIADLGSGGGGFSYWDQDIYQIRIFATGTYMSGGETLGRNIRIVGGVVDDDVKQAGGTGYLYGGDGGDTNVAGHDSSGGEVHIHGGHGGRVYGSATNSRGGNINLSGGAGSYNTYYGYGGDVVLRGGVAISNYVGSHNYAGDIRVEGGSASGGGYANFGGDANVVGGACIGVNASDTAGGVYITGGAATTHGYGGNVNITAGTGPDGSGQVIISGLPTMEPTVSGALWNSAGTLKIH